MFSVVDKIQSGPLKYLAADAAATNNFFSFIPIQEGAYETIAKKANLKALSDAVKQVRSIKPDDPKLQKDKDAYIKFRAAVMYMDPDKAE